MADPFDPTYFNNRITQELERNAQLGISNKFDQLEQAGLEKAQDFRNRAARSREIEAANAASIVGQIGFDSGGVIDTAVATVAAPLEVITSGAAAALNEAAEYASSDSAQSLRDLARKTQQKREAIRNLVGINPKTEERTSGIQQRLSVDPLVSLVQGSVAAAEGVVGLGSLVSGGRAGQLAEKGGFRPREANAALDTLLSPELRTANQAVEDAEGFTDTVGTMLENPSTIAQGIIKSVPSMVVGGAIGKAVTKIAPAVGTAIAGAIGEGTIMAGAQAENIRNQTEDKTLSFKQALAAAATGLAGTAIGVGGNRLAKSLGIGDIEESLVTGALTKPKHSIPTNIALTGAVEGGEELSQSSVEQMLSNVALDRPILEDVSDTAAVGLLTGAPMGGIAGAAQGARDKTAAAAQNQAEEASLTTAIASGDVTAYLDPQNASYAPQKAVQALLGNSRLATTTPEAKVANLARAGEIVAEMEATRQELNTKLARTTVEGLKAEIAERQQDTAQAELVGLLQAELVDLESGNPKILKEIKTEQDQIRNQIKKADTAIQQSQELLNTFTQESTPVADTADIEAANQPDPVVAQPAAEKVINLAMASPSNLDADTAQSLADNASNGLTTEQRAFLRSFSQARIQQNEAQSMGDVNDEILFGSKAKGNRPAQKGIAQYRANIASALATARKDTADRELADLRKFRDSQKQKSDLIAEAAEEVQRTGNSTQIINDGKNWVVNTGPRLSNKAQTENGGFTVHRGTPAETIQGILAGASALEAATAEMESAYALKFPQTEGTQNVTNLPQSSSTESEAQSSSDPVQTPEATGDSASVTAGDSSTTTDNQEQTAAPIASQEASASTVVSEEGTAAEVNAADASSTEGESDLTDVDVASVEDIDDVPEAAPESGALSVFSEQVPQEKSFKKLNLIAQFFTQTASHDGDKTKRPLVAVKNFLSEHYDDVLEYLDLDSLTDNQLNAVRTFSEAAAAWKDTIQKNLFKDTNTDFHYNDPIQFLVNQINGQLVIDENVRTAISYAGFSWVAENAGKSAYNTDEEINGILFRDENALVSRLERSILGNVGVRQNVIANTLGQRAVEALGLKAKKSAPLDLMPKLQTSLGVHVLKMLMDRQIPLPAK